MLAYILIAKVVPDGGGKKGFIRVDFLRLIILSPIFPPPSPPPTPAPSPPESVAALLTG